MSYHGEKLIKQVKEKINSYRLVLSSGSSITHTTTGTNIEIISFYYK